jgi:4-amino-4-deoxy-L-arabinose transferase-like glycosyltransferase
MTSLLCYFIPLFVIAVALDLFLVKGLQRFRKLKKESTDQEGILKISKWELLSQAFGGTRKNNTNPGLLQRIRKRFQRNKAHPVVESKLEVTAAQSNPDGKPSLEAGRGQVSFSVEPGTKVQITIEVGDTIVEGKVPLTVQVQHISKKGVQTLETLQPAYKPLGSPSLATGGLRAKLEPIKSRLRTYDLATWLFIAAVSIYLITRLIGLTRFPIYFFTDEAVQSLSMLDLMKHGYRDAMGVWLPTYFPNGEYYNLSLSVYLQWLPSLLFGRSAVATRATSVLVTLIAAISIGIILRDIFKMKHWWVGTLFLSITPAWFLHSRTAFETAEFVAFYAGTLCVYLLYRYKSPRYVYAAIFLGTLSFYTYSPAQVIVPLTALGLLISDWRYHWQNRRIVLKGIVLIIFLALPYARYMTNNPSVPFAHLHTLYSYWFEKISLSEKLRHYFSEFGTGLSPWYWYIPNDRDLPRHLMKDYGHIMLVTLPFGLLGMAQALRNFRVSAYRVIIIALLISPAAAALVQVSVTRALVFVVPAAILTAIGFEQVLQWLGDPKEHLIALSAGFGPTPLRIVVASTILLLGISFAFISKETTNRIALSVLVVILALQASGIFERLSQPFTRTVFSKWPNLWKFSQTTLALLAFVVLSGANVYMLNDALRNGPLWFRDYGLGGMQYGAFQIFDVMKQYVKEHPKSELIFSPIWANGADVVSRFFLGDSSPIHLGSIKGHILQQLPLDENTVFVMAPEDYNAARESDKITHIRIEKVFPYPDGSPGFYFIRLKYVDNIDEIFAAEKAARQVLQQANVMIDGQMVKLRYSYLDSDFQAESIALVFDDDPFTLAKTFESNPFILEMTFPKTRTISGFSIIIGSAKVQITLKGYREPGAQPIIHTFEGQGTRKQPKLSFDLPAPEQIRILQVEVRDPRSPEQAKIHIWELTLR